MILMKHLSLSKLKELISIMQSVGVEVCNKHVDKG